MDIVIELNHTAASMKNAAVLRILHSFNNVLFSICHNCMCIIALKRNGICKVMLNA